MICQKSDQSILAGKSMKVDGAKGLANSCFRKGEQLFEQLAKDGHCGREPKLQYGGKTMYYYPYQRPEKGRMKQKWYTLKRLTFQLFQLRKLFPNYAWHSYLGQFLS